MVWLWVLLAFALTPVLGGTFWALATEGRRNHPKWGVFRSVQYAHRGSITGSWASRRTPWRPSAGPGSWGMEWSWTST